MLSFVLTAAAAAAAQEPAWWSTRPLTAPSVPPRTEWGRNEVDAFVHAGLRQAGLEPGPEADRATLVRRLTFDLWGLPPTPDQVRAFVEDPRADAYERLVDRLLASPHHAERQAQHWLDVARYADTHGFDKDKRRPNAWPYRDWVVRAFEEDRSWSEFVERQVAGDLLDPGGPDVAASGFLAAGPWDFVGHVELREGTVDKQITRNLDRDEMARAVMTAFTSTTVGCARCHDHKFDPVSIEEYYGLQALFAGVERAEVSFEPDPEVGLRRAVLARAIDQGEAGLASLDEDLASRSGPTVRLLEAYLAGVERYRVPSEARADTARQLGYHSAIASSADVEKWVQVDLGASVDFDRVSLWPASERFGAWDGEGFGFPPRLSVLAGDDPELADGRVLLSIEGADLPNPGGAPLVVPGDGQPARYVRVVAHRLWARVHSSTDYCFALAELSVRSGPTELALGCAVRGLDSIEAGSTWGAARLTDGVLGEATLESVRGHAGLARGARVVRRAAGAASDLGGARAALETPADRARREALRNDLAAARLAHAELPGPATVYGAAREFQAQGNFRAPEGPRPVHVLDRGSVRSPGAPAIPSTLDLVDAKRRTLPLGAGDDQRRALLAHWLTEPGHPLTWRSGANRLWQWRFGQGLVLTSSDFGRMGGTPSHPELLDWLALQLRDRTPREVTRLLVTSATYRQSSVDRREGVAVDAGNRLLWRGPRRRLDAEEVHDALLAATGELDLEMGGPGFDRFGFEDDHSPRYLYDELDPGDGRAHRRALYRFVVRSVPDPWLATFDCPDPSLAAPTRAQTTTPLQALALFNSPFALARAEALAAVSDGPEDAWWRAVGRAPREEERAALRRHASERGLAATCRVILNSTAFLQVD